MYKRILVPIDGSATANRGLDEAIGLGLLTGASLRILHVLDELVFLTGFETGATYQKDILPALRAGAERIVAEGRARAVAGGVAADTLVAECFGRRASDVVVEQAGAWGADLIALGTHGRRGIGRALLGSDAEQIVRGSPVPVLLVRDAAAVAARPAAAPVEKAEVA